MTSCRTLQASLGNKWLVPKVHAFSVKDPSLPIKEQIFFSFFFFSRLFLNFIGMYLQVPNRNKICFLCCHISALCLSFSLYIPLFPYTIMPHFSLLCTLVFQYILLLYCFQRKQVYREWVEAKTFYLKRNNSYLRRSIKILYDVSHCFFFFFFSQQNTWAYVRILYFY